MLVAYRFLIALGIFSVWPLAWGGAGDASLGEKLFFDQRLSGGGEIACASCHQVEKAFQDGRAKAVGSFERVGSRNTPSLLNVSYQQSLFWDGRRVGLAAQALDPLLNHREHAMGSASALASKIRSLQDYRTLTAPERATGKKPNDAEILLRVSQALAAFESTITDGESRFDRFMYAKDKAALTDAARRGWLLFSGRAQCIACHQVGPTAPALFTDHDFHVLPITLNRIQDHLPQLVTRFMSAKALNANVGQTLLSDDDMAELGRFAVTENPADIGKFKTPSLRNVALTAPYMHDGSVATLAQAVDLEIYYRGTQDGRPLVITPIEREDLIAFLEALTGDKALGKKQP
ncbi:MAG: cytochrome c peroxidase [Aquabacterium sp.]